MFFNSFVTIVTINLRMLSRGMKLFNFIVAGVAILYFIILKRIVFFYALISFEKKAKDNKTKKDKTKNLIFFILLPNLKLEYYIINY